MQDNYEDGRAREGGAGEGAEVRNNNARSFSTGGRKRARSIGEFMQGLYLVGRLNAPELQEGAAAASSSSSSRPTEEVEGLAQAGSAGRHRGNVSMGRC